MRRKSERTAGKKVKASPEKKVEKIKRTRSSRRRKQSESSENESADEASPVREVVVPPVLEKTPVKAKEESPEDAPDQVWQVKTAQTPNETGEIGKLKLCLARPPSTPERVDRSPRSRRKHSRATSSSDTPSNEGADEKKKGRGRYKRSRESKDDNDLSHDTSHESQGDEAGDMENDKDTAATVSQSSEAQSNEDETPMSTTDDTVKTDHTTTTSPKGQREESQKDEAKEEESSPVDNNKASDADTTVQSPTKDEPADTNERPKTPCQRISSVDKSEVLEIHANDSKMESSEVDIQVEEKVPEEQHTDTSDEKEQPSPEKENEVSISMDSSKQSVSKEDVSAQVESTEVTNKTNVVEGSEGTETSGEPSANVDKYQNKQKNIEVSVTTSSTQDEPIPNGQAAPLVINRKRRWGSRPKLSSQKSITISTDVLKDIIPDVKPVEFDEVIEEKKHKRIEVKEKFDRPVLPKITIDNTEHVEKQKKEQPADRDNENVKKMEPQIGANRKISIINDNDSIISRPPSPPRHKQSCILYITNLVRPFTLQQLKNLLQRTGKIVDEGFWIDRIKSRCFVKYQSEDQAVETRHALHGVTWPVSNPKTLQVDFSSDEAFEKTKSNLDADTAPVSAIPGTVEDWLREQDQKKERGETDKPWERKAVVREWDVGKNDKDKEKDKLLRRDDRPADKRRHRSAERSPEPARKFKKKEEEAPAKLLDDLFRKTKTTPCIYWLPLSAETIAVKEEQRRQHMLEHERRMLEMRRRRH